MKYLYIISFTKNGVAKTYQIPSTSELNAAVRLGQIYGDAYPREDISINIISIKKSGIYL